MNKSAFILVLTLFFISIHCAGQVTDELVCRVIDSESKIPISYATIQILNTSKGTVANVDGAFRIPLLFKNQNGQIKISSIGFESKVIDLQHLSNSSINVIEITPKAEQLNQVVIKSSKSKKEISPYAIVQNAIRKIPNNYPTSSFSKIGYYRDYQVVNSNYYNLNEAIIESYDAGFQTDVIMNDSNQNALYSYKENKTFQRDSVLLMPYDGKNKRINNTEVSGQGGNELGILNIHNPIRNYEQLSFSFVYIFEKKFLDNHDLTNLKKVYLNDEVLYEISFKAKDVLTKASHKASGKIFIGKSDFAIYKFTYDVYEVKNLHPLLQINIEYKKKNDLMYLNYITFNNQFIINKAFKFDVNGVDYDKDKKAFYVNFNSAVDSNTIDKRDFRFKFNRKKLLINDIELIDRFTVKLKIADWVIPDLEFSTDMSSFSYKIKNIYDVKNRKLYQEPKLVGFQFREFFVQEIFEDKITSGNLIFINKYQPLAKAVKNSFPNASEYWLNSPLKDFKN